MARKKSILAAAAVLAMAAGLVGCSGGNGGADADDGAAGKTATTELQGSSPQEIAEKTVDAMKAAESLRVKGRMTTDGKQLDVDMALTEGGKCTGSMAMDGGTAEVIGTGTETYIKADEQFWRNQSQGEPGAETIVQMLKNRWMKAGAQDAGAGAGEFCDLDALLADMDANDTGAATKGEVTEVNGQPAIPLTEKEDGGTTTVHVANDDDKPYILRMENKGGDEPGVMDFTDYDKPVEIEEPAPSEVVDLEKLRQSGAR